ncbi:uncharacterized protein TNCV_2794441 [Trichonephila clavipes]|nr:uncharacterized protein TNCV_2794441 [Trichonephila clavipes]
MNQASASEAQTQQCSLNSSLGDTFGSPLVHFGGQLLNGSPSICPNTSPQTVVRLCHLWPVVHHICHVADFEQSHFAMHGTLLPRRHANSSQTQPFRNASTLGPKANDHALLTSDKSLRFCITPTIEMFSEALTHPLYTLNCTVLPPAFCDWLFNSEVESKWWSH